MGTITIIAALGGFGGPWAYRGSQTAQGYPDGQIATLCLFCASIVAYIILWYVQKNLYCTKMYLFLLSSLEQAFYSAKYPRWFIVVTNEY